MARTTKIILVDADVVSHFIIGSEILILPSIFSYKMKILDKVYSELEDFKKKKIQIDNLINLKLIEIIPFPEENNEIKKEFFWIKKMMFKGEGESACLAVARYTKDIIGSSNLKDVKNYCKTHSIENLTTMDFLAEALRTKRMDIQRCNNFIAKVLKGGSKLPVKCMEEYLKIKQ